MAWCIVHFEEDNSVQVVPQTWVNGDQCLWPKISGKNSQELFNKAVKNSLNPDKSWTSYKIRILGIFKTFNEARKKLKVAEEQSDLGTDAETKENRKNKKRKVISSGSESEDNSDTDWGIKPFPEYNNRSVKHQDTNHLNTMTSLMNKETSLLNNNNSTNDKSDSNKSLDQGPENNCLKNKEASSTDSRFEQYIKWNIVNIKLNIEKIMTMLQSRQECSCGRSQINDMPCDEYYEWNLPLNTINEVHALERQLRQLASSNDYIKQLVTYLSHIGGFKTEEITKLILRKLLVDDVAAMFSWQGKKGKKIFSDLMLSNVIIKAVQASPNGKTATDMDVIINIKNWLRHAPQRRDNNKDNKSNNRSKRGDEAETEERGDELQLVTAK